jgi:hypothetical protein
MDFLCYEGLSVDETGEDMVEGYVGITYRELLISFRVNPKAFVYLEDCVEIEAVSSTLIYDIHLWSIFGLFESRIIFVVKLAPSWRPNNNDTLVHIW